MNREVIITAVIAGVLTGVILFVLDKRRKRREKIIHDVRVKEAREIIINAIRQIKEEGILHELRLSNSPYPQHLLACPVCDWPMNKCVCKEVETVDTVDIVIDEPVKE